MNNVEVKSSNLDTFLKAEFIEMTFDIEAKSRHIFKGIGYYWMSKKSSNIFQVLCNCEAHFTSFFKFVYGGN